MDRTYPRNLALLPFDYLCLKIAANPGKSAYWYLKALNGYKQGNSRVPMSWARCYFKEGGEYVGGYLTRVDKTKSKRRWDTYELLPAGMVVARKAAKKIGLTLP